MPLKSEVRSEVLRIVSTFTTLAPDAIQGTHVLKSPPLLMDDTGLGFLAAKLRTYAHQFDNAADVKATELRKSGLTVDGLVDLVQRRTGAA